MRQLLACLLLTACSSTVAEKGDPGPAGPRGETGRVGPRGMPGEAWQPVTYVVRAQVDVPADADPSGAVAQVYCDEGDLVLHGGCQWGDWRGDHVAEVRAYLQGPIGQEGGPNTFRGWQCHGVGTGEASAVYVVATCLEMGD